ncbi:MAG: glycosyltransferase family 2 protein [Elusimicrobiota bacterium]|jgi:dolichol-phosphate mannosyltransferase
MPAREVRCVIPAYNEEKNLPRLCETLREAFAALGRPYRLFIVDDGSRDGTAALLRELALRHPLTPLFHEGNRGIAAAFLTGLRAAVAGAAEDDPIVMLEGDGTSDPAALSAMLDALTPPCDLVIASRYAPGGAYRNFPPKRLLLSRGANALLSVLCRVPGVRDYTIFYRAYRAGPLARALGAFGERFTSAGGFACNAEMLLRLRAFVREVREVPFVYDYGLKKGKSAMNIPRNLRSYLSLFRIFYFERRGA